jgi:hypothetical protein
MAQIQIWTRDVNGTSLLKGIAPQHTFFIKVNDNGTREIIRGGPINDNMIVDDIIYFGSSEIMDIVCERYDYVEEYVTKNNAFHPELFFGYTIFNNLKKDNILIKNLESI